MEIEKISYLEAIRKVALDLGIPIRVADFDNQHPDKSKYDNLYQTNQFAMDFFVAQSIKASPSRPREYLKKRSLSLNTIKKFQIGYAPNSWDAFLREAKKKKFDLELLQELGLIQKKENGVDFYDKFRNRIMFPFHNASGHVVGFGGRRLVDIDQPKYLNSPECRIYKKGEILYGLYQSLPSIRDKKYAILVEGYFDLLRLVDVGIENVVASSGTALTETQGRLLRRFTNSVIISYDSDEAGIKASLRNSQILESLDLDVYLIQIPPPDDPDSYILKQGKNAYLELIAKKISPVEFLLKEFITHQPDATIEAKNQFIDEIFETLLQVPNDVKIGLYIHQLSEKLELGESFLISRFNRLKKKRRFQKKFTSETEFSETSVPKYRKGEWRAEEGIISLLLLNKIHISKQIMQHVSALDFENEDLRILFEYISDQWEDFGEIHVDSIHKKISSQENTKILSKLIIQEIQEENKFAVDCIYKIRKRSLDMRFNEIKKLMNEEAGSDESMLHYMRELTDIRQKITEIENERSRHFKLGS